MGERTTELLEGASGFPAAAASWIFLDGGIPSPGSYFSKDLVSQKLPSGSWEFPCCSRDCHECLVVEIISEMFV